MKIFLLVFVGLVWHVMTITGDFEECVLTEWRSWTYTCPDDCAGETSTRYRTAVTGSCSFVHLSEVKNCGNTPPRNCSLSHWLSWSPCFCNQTRERTRLLIPRRCKASVCEIDWSSPNATQTEMCADHSVDCVVGNFTQWSGCIPGNECGRGLRRRSRSILVQPVCSGRACPHLNEGDECVSNVNPCPPSTTTLFDAMSKLTSSFFPATAPATTTTTTTVSNTPRAPTTTASDTTSQSTADQLLTADGSHTGTILAIVFGLLGVLLCAALAFGILRWDAKRKAALAHNTSSSGNARDLSEFESARALPTTAAKLPKQLFPCHICAKRYTSQRDLDVHTKARHPNADEMDYNKTGISAIPEYLKSGVSATYLQPGVSATFSGSETFTDTEIDLQDYEDLFPDE